MVIIWIWLRMFIIISGCEYYFWTGISLTKDQFVVTHTIRQTDIPPLLYTFCQNFVSTKKIASLYDFFFFQTVTWLHVGLLRICTDFSSVSCKTVYRCDLTNCCFISEIWIKSDEKMTWLQTWPGYTMRTLARTTHAPANKRSKLKLFL